MLFNTKSKSKGTSTKHTKKTKSLQGGVTYTYKSFMNLYTLLVTKKLNKGSYYRSQDQEIKKLIQAVDNCVKDEGIELTCKLIVYTRSSHGMRSTSHVAAARVMEYLSGEEIGRMFYSKRSRKGNNGGVVFRIDDMYEIAAAFTAMKAIEKGVSPNNKGYYKGIHLPNAMKKGFKQVLETSDWHILAKYQAKGHTYCLSNMIKLLRPRPNKSVCWTKMSLEEYISNLESNRTKNMSPIIDDKIESAKRSTDSDGNVRVCAFEAATFGFLKENNTRQSMNSKTGQDVAKKLEDGTISKKEAQTELLKGKTDNYHELFDSKRMPYFDLLRNLRNIHDLATSTRDKPLLEKACALLVNEKVICKAGKLIFPYQVEQARDVMLELDTVASKRIVMHLDRAYDIACSNLEDLGFFGSTAVILDSSQSMNDPVVKFDRNNKSHREGRSGLSYNGKTARENGALIAGTIAKGTGADVYQYADACNELKYDPSDNAFVIAKKIGEQTDRSELGYGTNFTSIFNQTGSRKYQARTGWSGRRVGGGTATVKGSTRGIRPVDRIFIISDMQNGTGNCFSALKQWQEHHGITGTYVYLINVNSYGDTVMPDSNDPRIVNAAGYSYEMLRLLVEQEVNPNALREEVMKINMNPQSK